MPDFTVAASPIHGIGVFTTSPYARGDSLLVLDDSRVVDDAHPLRPEFGEHLWTCNCGTPSCRGTNPSSFFDLPLAKQRRLLPLLDAWFVREHDARIAGVARDVGQSCALRS